jgi:hypothetical protein
VPVSRPVFCFQYAGSVRFRTFPDCPLRGPASLLPATVWGRAPRSDRLPPAASCPTASRNSRAAAHCRPVRSCWVDRPPQRGSLPTGFASVLRSGIFWDFSGIFLPRERRTAWPNSSLDLGSANRRQYTIAPGQTADGPRETQEPYFHKVTLGRGRPAFMYARLTYRKMFIIR